MTTAEGRKAGAEGRLGAPGPGALLALLVQVNVGRPGGILYPATGPRPWDRPGIDHLSAMMLALTGLLGLALVFGTVGWHRQGFTFPSLFQFLLMGLYGAFLTGDSSTSSSSSRCFWPRPTG